jgi:DNA-binding transcriptional regulator YiaG
MKKMNKRDSIVDDTLKLKEVTVSVIDDYETGKAVRALRKETGMNITEFANLLGYTRSYLSELERGARHWRKPLVALAVDLYLEVTNG